MTRRALALLLTLALATLAAPACDSGSGDGNNNAVHGPGCGNGILEEGELCDRQNTAGATCESEGLGPGILICNSTCDGLDTSYCGVATQCGDGVANGTEACDGADLRNATCEDLGLDGGDVLSCNADCTQFDLSNCTSCGDGTQQGAEDCDGTDLNGETCNSQGFDGGSLGCFDICVYDTRGCTIDTCGNNNREGVEACDGNDLDGEDCVSQGFISGNLACDPSCTTFDTSGCVPAICGNDTAEGNEACDGTDLRGEDCLSQGFNSGTLACAGDCLTFDQSGCSMNFVGSQTQGPGLSLAIADGTYDGTPTDCVIFDMPTTGGSDLVQDVMVDIAIDHTWVGDLTIKLTSPQGTTVTLLSRPGLAEVADDGTGCCGDDSDLSVAFPISFNDGAAFPAESMGASLNDGEVVCQDDLECNFIPNPGAGPGVALADFVGEDATSVWMLCFGDSGGGDVGSVDEATLTITTQP